MPTNTNGCLGCGNTKLQPIINFGDSPLADQLLTKDKLSAVENTYPLEVVFCPICYLVQLVERIDQVILYGGDYPYFTSVSSTLVEHFTKSAKNIINLRKLDSKSLVIEAASNDGYMLKIFHEKGIPVLGIDPAKGPAEVANQNGIRTLCRFFDRALCAQLAAEGKTADVILGNNVLNLVHRLDDFIEGLNIITNADGLVVLEVPYLVNLIDQCAFDMIFHQNIYYFSMTALFELFKRHSFFINDVREIKTFGGSLRLFIEKKEKPQQSVIDLLEEETKKGINGSKYYRSFAQKVENIKIDLKRLLKDIKDEGKSIAVYGAAGGMATTLMSYLDLNHTLINLAVDSNSYKQGKYTPGSHFLIHSPKMLIEKKIDYVLLLAWNYEKEIIQKERTFHELGGRFILPLPEPKII